MYTNHIILDLEFNPVSFEDKKAKAILKNEIIEIGAVKLDKHLRMVDRFKCFIKPEHNNMIIPMISRLTGIHTATAFKAETFAPAMEQFVEWIGSGDRTRIYSWSDTDYQQLKREYAYKKIPMPDCFNRIMDLQKIFPRMMKINNLRKTQKMALREAVLYMGVDLNNKKAHDALYDAEITSELLKPLLNGEYRNQVNCLNQFTQPSNNTTTLGDVCGGVLMNLLLQMQMETA